MSCRVQRVPTHSTKRTSVPVRSILAPALSSNLFMTSILNFVIRVRLYPARNSSGLMSNSLSALFYNPAGGYRVTRSANFMVVVESFRVCDLLHISEASNAGYCLTLFICHYSLPLVNPGVPGTAGICGLWIAPRFQVVTVPVRVARCGSTLRDMPWFFYCIMTLPGSKSYCE